MEDNVIKQYRHVHLGFAVALEEGLITPVIRDCDEKKIVDLAREVAELGERGPAEETAQAGI